MTPELWTFLLKRRSTPIGFSPGLRVISTFIIGDYCSMKDGGVQIKLRYKSKPNSLYRDEYSLGTVSFAEAHFFDRIYFKAVFLQRFSDVFFAVQIKDVV